MDRGEVASDASSLIYLAKADAFEDAVAAVGVLLIPSAVWDEAVVAGEQIGATEVPRMHAAVQRGLARRIELDDEQRALATTIRTEHRLGAGESEVLAWGVESRCALLDEGRATRVAERLGVVPVSTLFLPLVGRRDRALDEERALSFLRKVAVVTGARAETTFVIERHIREEGT